MPARVNVLSSRPAARLSFRDYLPEPQEIPLFVCFAVLAIFIGVNLAKWRSTNSHIDTSIWPYTSRDACHAHIERDDIGCFKHPSADVYQYKHWATAFWEDQSARDSFSLQNNGVRAYGSRTACETDDGTLRRPRICQRTTVSHLGRSIPIFTPDPHS